MYAYVTLFFTLCSVYVHVFVAAGVCVVHALALLCPYSLLWIWVRGAVVLISRRAGPTVVWIKPPSLLRTPSGDILPPFLFPTAAPALFIVLS